MDSKHKEILQTCLKCFVENGYAQTTTRDLSKALNLQSGGMYYYFKSKAELTIACAEEAALMIEKKLISIALDNLYNPDKFVKVLKEESEKIAPVMKFFVGVCVSKKYRDDMKNALNRFEHRYNYYAEQMAKKLDEPIEKIKPLAYIGFNAVINYMTFGESDLAGPQMQFVMKELREILKKFENKTA